MEAKTGVASCMAKFNVKQPRPPVIACSSDPGTIRTGGRATIRASASSPDGRSLSYSYSSSAGNVSGTDASATLNSQGAQPGPITVTCNVSDDRNLTASSTAMVNVEAPPPPPPPPTPCSSDQGVGNQACPPQHLFRDRSTVSRTNPREACSRAKNRFW